MKHVMTLLTILGLSMLVSACNTMAGIGEDVEAGGDKLERSAEKNKRY
jgi:entericidin B